MVLRVVKQLGINELSPAQGTTSQPIKAFEGGAQLNSNSWTSLQFHGLHKANGFTHVADELVKYGSDVIHRMMRYVQRTVEGSV